MILKDIDEKLIGMNQNNIKNSLKSGYDDDPFQIPETKPNSFLTGF